MTFAKNQDRHFVRTQNCKVGVWNLFRSFRSAFNQLRSAENRFLTPSHSTLQFPLVLGTLVGAALVCAVCTTPSVGRAQGASSSNPAIKVDLKTTLEKGLRCRRPQEFAYIAAVIEMVDSGELPETLVRNIFGWARRRQRYPLQAFQFALQRQAARQGINDVPTIQNNNVNLTSSSGS